MKLKAVLIFLSLVLVYSCGRQIEESDPAKPPGRTPRDTPPRIDLGSFIKKQKLLCEDVLFCPDNVAKLVVVENDKIQFCTGTLAAPNKIVTSASCLFKSLRIPNLDCSNNIFAVFPENIYEDEIKAGCKKIEYVDSNPFQEAALWKSDIAVIELDQEIPRKFSQFTEEGPGDEDKLIAWKVDYETDFMGTLRQDRCKSILNTYLNPFSRGQDSPMFVMTGCNLEESNIGAPLFKGDKIAGIFSTEMSSRIYSYLQTGGLVNGEIGRYYHATNTSCSKGTSYRSSLGVSDDCLISTSVGQLDFMRSKILKNKAVHASKMRQALKKLEAPRKYFKWNFEFLADARSTRFEASLKKPRCIWRPGDWIAEFRRWRSIRTYAQVVVERPNYVFTTKLNSNLRAVSVMENKGMKTYTVEFNPYEAYVNRNTYVTVTSELHGREYQEDFKNVTLDCRN